MLTTSDHTTTLDGWIGLNLLQYHSMVHLFPALRAKWLQTKVHILWTSSVSSDNKRFVIMIDPTLKTCPGVHFFLRVSTLTCHRLFRLWAFLQWPGLRTGASGSLQRGYQGDGDQKWLTFGIFNLSLPEILYFYMWRGLNCSFTCFLTKGIVSETIEIHHFFSCSWS